MMAVGTEVNCETKGVWYGRQKGFQMILSIFRNRKVCKIVENFMCPSSNEEAVLFHVVPGLEKLP